MTTSTYDLVPYESDAIPATRPEHVAMTSWLHGGPLPEIERPRVLDVGCGDGTNIMALACHNPHGHFVGFDYSAVQIELGREACRELGLTNLELVVADILTPGDLGGPFDFVIVHGVYSWVPPEIRARLLALCAEQLAPNGLAYVSYNVHPGWTIRSLVRELVLSPTAGVEEPRERAAAAVELGRLRRAALPTKPDHPYQALIARELGLFSERSTSSLVHEYLADVNQPFYFTDFLQDVGAHELAYVGDAMFNKAGGRVPDALRTRLHEIGFRGAELEQLIDLLRYRQFRCSLLCRPDAQRPEPPAPEKLEGLHLTAHVEPPAAPVELRPGVEVAFTDRDGVDFKCADPLLKATLLGLADRNPGGCTVGEALASAVASLAAIGLRVEPPLDKFCQVIVMLHRQGVIELHLRPPALPTGLKPQPLARFEAEHRRCATTPYHDTLRLNPLLRWLLRRAEETSEPAQLLLELRTSLDAGELTLPQENAEVSGDGEELARRLTEALELLYRRGIIGRPAL